MTLNKIRAVSAHDITSLKNIIASTDLFPPDLLDDMTTSYFDGNPQNEIWLTTYSTQGVLYCKPEYLTQSTVNLLLMAVTQTEQRKGLGTALLLALESQLRERGVHLLLVETSTLDSYDAARAFYQRNGFAPVATIHDFYSKGEGKIIYSKSL